MTITKKIVFFPALALGGFFEALYLFCGFALLNVFTRLESDYARENIHHLQNELTNQQSQLELMARDYGQWDRTYDFMESKDPEYVRTELTDDTFKIIHINIFLLLDPSEQLVVHQSLGSLTPDAGDLQTITIARLNAPTDGNGPSQASGILQLKGRVFLFAYQPILTSRGNGKPGGTPAMGREFDLSLLSSFSTSAGVPRWLEPAEQAPQAPMSWAAWRSGTNSARFERDATILAYVAIKH